MMSTEDTTRQSTPCAAAKALKDNRIDISFECNGQTYGLGERIGKLKRGEDVKMTIRVAWRRNLMPVVAYGNIDQSGEGTIETLGNGVDGNDEVYTWVIPIGGSEPFGFPTWPNNRVYVLVEGLNGTYELYLVGAFAQDHATWTWAELGDEGRLTRDSDGKTIVSTPSFLWTALIEALDEAKRYKRRTLFTAPAEAANPDDQMIANMSEVARGEGIVQYFNMFMGTGHVWFRRIADGTIVGAKIHFSSLPRDRETKLRTLKKGQLVTGQLRMATHATGPQKGQPRPELKEVRVVG